ncbi:MAG: flagellar assembly peptidoglycan hydrolase FlgJ [Aquabacterium sp.]
MALTPRPGGLSTDLRSLDQLKATAGQDPRLAIRDTAKQLEGLFMQELMKSMRATTMSSGMLDNSGTEMGASMLDQQFATQMTGLPGGLSDMIARQLERQMGIRSDQPAAAANPSARMLGSATPNQALDARLNTDRSRVDAQGRPVAANGRALSASEQFVRKHQAAARAAEEATGIPAGNILGQAALESGWGKREIKTADGQPSHNLFGIKATSAWKGKVAEVTTTEYIGGVARKVTAKFRAYDSYEEAFKDHARLLTQSPRYSQTVAQADTAQGYARGLQKAGYATDPAYADKLTRVINTALRLQRTVT